MITCTNQFQQKHVQSINKIPEYQSTRAPVTRARVQVTNTRARVLDHNVHTNKSLVPQIERERDNAGR